ncbi:HAD hydrolase-like protein [Miniphocaeibacter massiliensis]|uniref:HAD hydrolase-like protein n=1 Tax=Miniphocaeibacter massiliensis TaxID=2041841 RepID=UPI0013EB88F3|nr:HAD hydrolase-like protein [Miniphocaeibacter massiliensis]
MIDKYIIFDLDGTIIDSFEGMKESIKYSLKQIKLDIVDEKIINQFIGYPLIDSYMKYFKVDEKVANYLVSFYRDYYKEQGVLNARIYEGIIDVIKELKKMGYKIAIVSLKPKVFVYRILKNLGIFENFDNIVGIDWNNYEVTKIDLMNQFIELIKLDLTNSYFIGDRNYDILTGQRFGVKTIGVSYGYGTIEELESASPNYIVHSPREIIEIVI